MTAPQPLIPRAALLIHRPPKLQRWKPASQSRLPRRLQSPFQCNHIPRRCSPSCSCDLHFFFPQLRDLARGCFPVQVFQAEHPARPAAHRQHQPCSFHLSVRVSFQTELRDGAGGFFPGHITYTAQLTAHPQLARGRRRRQREVGGWQKSILPPKIPGPPQLCRDGEHRFIIIRPLLHPARKATAAIPLGSLLVKHIVRNATLIFAEY